MKYTDILIGEYSNYYGAEDGTAWTHDNNKLSKYSIPEKGKMVIAGHPYGYFIGESGTLYMLTGDNTTFKKIADRVKLVGAYWNWAVVVFDDNTIGVYKDGVKYSTLVSPGKVVQISAAHRIVMRCEDGSVWEYEWSSVPWKSGVEWQKTAAIMSTLAPKKVVLPGAATWVTTSRLFFSAAIVNGIVYAWGDSFAAKYFGWSGAFAPKEVQAHEHMIIVEASDHNLHAIDTEGFLHGMGGLGVGFVGDGRKEPDVLADGGWPSMVVKTFVTSFVLLNDRKYDKIAPGSSYKFRFAAHETNGLWNTWGYEKFGLLDNGLKMVVSATNTAHDTTTAGLFSVPSPRRIEIPELLVNTPVADGKAMISAGKYPPAEATVPEPPPPVRKAIATLYDDGTWEEVK